ncbi:transcription factor 21 [Cephus cinctus]|uniref:Transcription factor 21 n=1 Tax=Cephus cinctus TaxID=211228 RepID=A0AAJ7CGW6_CEPCN|nr:transcription factor 21 [Cephus cinctus]XP_015610315.1 transcription factor 21 [Cephus cinctus]XP_024935669.1 transcription factor 21 [Cephus cinctus]XP_024935670.1 transcription factor 21 [Cephus cinctus]
MPKKRRISTTSLEADDEDYASEDKYSKDEVESRAPRNAANARERARMRVLSKAFCRLKTTLPWVPADTKLSKLDTLRLAATYIAHLRAVLRDDVDPHYESTKSLSLALSWPFAIQGTSNPMLLNNGCNSSGSSSSPDQNQYRGQHIPHETPTSHHHHHHHHFGHQNLSIRHSHDSQITYY